MPPTIPPYSSSSSSSLFKLDSPPKCPPMNFSHITIIKPPINKLKQHIQKSSNTSESYLLHLSLNPLTKSEPHIYSDDWLFPTHHKVLYDRTLHTGLGDRFMSYLCAATVAQALNKIFVTTWHDYSQGGSDRTYPWKYIEQYVHFPSSLYFDNHDQENMIRLEQEQQQPNNYFPEILLPPVTWMPPDYDIKNNNKYLPSMYGFDGIFCSKTFYCLSDLQIIINSSSPLYQSVANEFYIDLQKLSPETNQLLNSFKGNGFIVFHARFGDKYNPKKDNYHQYCTIQAIQAIKQYPMIIISDNQTLALSMVEQIKGKNIHVLQSISGSSSSKKLEEDWFIRSLFSWLFSQKNPGQLLTTITNTKKQAEIESNTLTSLRDLAVMFKAKGIIQQSPYGWSSFSFLPALMNKAIPLLSTYQSPNRTMLQNIRDVGKLPGNILSCGDGSNIQQVIDQFVKLLV
jgi:hypothetical protein